MNKFFAKVVCLSVFIFVVVATTATVTAQNNFRYLFKETRLDANRYTAGEIVSGFFTIENKTSQPLDSLLYQIEFTTVTPAQSEVSEPIEYSRDAVDATTSVNVVRAEAEVRYLSSDAIVTSPLQTIESIGPRQEQQVRFSFALPERLPEGDLGIVVQLYDDSLRKGEKEIIPLEINSPRQYTLFKQLSLLTINNEESFGPLDGPIVEKTESINLFLSVENTSKNTVQIMPTFEYFSGGLLDGELVETVSQDPMLLRSGEQEGVTHILPVSSRDPGEYTIKITHTDIAGNHVTTPLYVRYFVGGMKAEIVAVDYNGFDMNELDEFIATVSYEPQPFNIRTGKNVAQQSAAVQTLIFDTKNDSLITQTETIPFRNQKTTTVVLPTSLPSGEYIMQYHLYEGDTIIQTRNDVVVIVGSTAVDALQKKTFSDYTLQLGIAVVLFTVVVIASVILLVRQRRKKTLQNQTEESEYVPKKFEVD